MRKKIINGQWVRAHDRIGPWAGLLRRAGSLLLAMTLLVPVLAVSGCQANANPNVTTIASFRKHPLVGFAMDTLVIERWESDRNIFMAAVNSYGGEVIVQNANSSSQEQKNQIRYLIDKGVDVLVIVAIDESQLREELLLAENDGIKVIAYDRMINLAGVDLYVSFDNEEVGRLMAESMIVARPAGHYAIVNGAATDSNTTLIRKGIQSVLDRHPECVVVAEATADNWSADDAFVKIKSILERQPNLDGIICANDAIAGAAVRALAFYRKSGTVAVTGQDADLDACQRIVENRQLMTVYKPIADLAKSAAKSAVALAAGNPLEANDTVLINGLKIPFQRIRTVAVNRGNIAEIIIKGGFHSYKDVYRNVSPPESSNSAATS